MLCLLGNTSDPLAYPVKIAIVQTRTPRFRAECGIRSAMTQSAEATAQRLCRCLLPSCSVCTLKALLKPLTAGTQSYRRSNRECLTKGFTWISPSPPFNSLTFLKIARGAVHSMKPSGSGLGIGMITRRIIVCRQEGSGRAGMCMTLAQECLETVQRPTMLMVALTGSS